MPLTPGSSAVRDGLSQTGPATAPLTGLMKDKATGAFAKAKGDYYAASPEQRAKLNADFEKRFGLPASGSSGSLPASTGGFAKAKGDYYAAMKGASPEERAKLTAAFEKRFGLNPSGTRAPSDNSFFSPKALAIGAGAILLGGLAGGELSKDD